MAVPQTFVEPHRLTYEQYLAEGEVNQRYDILDGVRIVTNPTRRHQRILRNIARLFEDYESASGRGEAICAPCDILIQRRPLRTRQPDLLFIGNERLAQNPPPTDPSPLLVAPELVVEILSPSDTEGVMKEKLRDYRKVGVLECWVVNVDTRIVEVLDLIPSEVRSIALYGADQAAQSVIF